MLYEFYHNQKNLKYIHAYLRDSSVPDHHRPEFSPILPWRSEKSLNLLQLQICLQIYLLTNFPLKHFIKDLFTLIHLLFVPPNEEGADKPTQNQEEAPEPSKKGSGPNQA